MGSVPDQKPGRSKQDYVTPANFVDAVKLSLGITGFTFDFAADATNAQAPQWWDLAANSLSHSPAAWAAQCRDGWGWLNPPFDRIAPWAHRCAQTKALGGSIAFLTPASVGANWFVDHVADQALVLFLNGRLHFMPEHPTWGYPKDCILSLFSPDIPPGYQVWSWQGIANREQADGTAGEEIVDDGD